MSKKSGKDGIGKKRMQQILGKKSDEIIDSFKKVSPEFAKYVVEFAYGDVYARKGFSDKHRELAAVACIIGQGNPTVALKTHLRGMLNVGWKKKEIFELLIFLIAFAGFPACVEAFQSLKQILHKPEPTVSVSKLKIKDSKKPSKRKSKGKSKQRSKR